MSIEVLQTSSLVFYIIAGVLVLVAVAMFFLLNIPKVFGDITGATARKAIESIRKQNELSGDKKYKTSAVNRERGKLTDKIEGDGSIKPRKNSLSNGAITEKFATDELTPKASETTLLYQETGETALLSDMNDAGNTEALSVEQLIVDNKTQAKEPEADIEVEIDVEMGFTGSSELIE